MKKPLKILILLAIIFLSILFVYHNKNLPEDLEKEKIAYFETKECSIKKKGASGSDTIFHSDFDDGVDLVFTDYKLLTKYESDYTKLKIVKNENTLSEITPDNYNSFSFSAFPVMNNIDIYGPFCSPDGRFVILETSYIAIDKSCYPNPIEDECLYIALSGKNIIIDLKEAKIIKHDSFQTITGDELRPYFLFDWLKEKPHTIIDSDSNIYLLTKKFYE